MTPSNQASANDDFDEAMAGFDRILANEDGIRDKLVEAGLLVPIEKEDASVTPSNPASGTNEARGAEACTASEPHGECRFGNGPAKGKYSGWRCYRAERAIGAGTGIEPFWLAIAIDDHTLAYGPSSVIHEDGTCSTDCAGDIAARYNRERAARLTPRPGEMQEANREMEADLWNSDR